MDDTSRKCKGEEKLQQRHSSSRTTRNMRGPWYNNLRTMEGEVERQDSGFIHRELSGCVFVSVQDSDFESSVPMRHPRNIINRGDIEVEAIQNLMEKIVSSSKEDGASADAGAEAVDEDAVDMEENDVTVGGMDGKMLRNVFNHFPLHDIRSTLACVNMMTFSMARIFQ